MAGKKRTCKTKSHEEQAKVLQAALEPSDKARKWAGKGQKSIAKNVEEGESVLQERLK